MLDSDTSFLSLSLPRFLRIVKLTKTYWKYEIPNTWK